MKSHIVVPKSFLKRFIYGGKLKRINFDTLQVEDITTKQSKLFTKVGYYNLKVEHLFQNEIEIKLGKFIKNIETYDSRKVASKHLLRELYEMENILALQISRIGKFPDQVLNQSIMGKLSNWDRNDIIKYIYDNRSILIKYVFHELKWCVLINKSKVDFILGSSVFSNIQINGDNGMIFTVSPKIAIAFLPPGNSFVVERIQSEQKVINIHEVIRDEYVELFNNQVSLSEFFHYRESGLVIGAHDELIRICDLLAKM